MQRHSDGQMQLRQHTRLPGRYREEEVPDLPPNPTFVVPTVLFNPNLSPAAFPTIPLDFFPPTKDASQAIAGDNEDPLKLHLQAPQAGLTEMNKMARPATVFRDTRIAKRGMKGEQDKRYSKTLDDIGEYDGYSTENTTASDKILSKSHLKAYDARVEWADLPDSVKFIMIREFNREMPFEHTVEFLRLEDGDIRYFINLYERELERHREEGERISRANERQLALLMSGCYGRYDTKQEEWSEIMEEEIYDRPFQEPTTFTISRRDIRLAKRFLQDFRHKHEFSRPEARNVPSFSQLKSIVTRLEQYLGVNTSWDDIEIGVLEYWRTQTRELVPQYSPQSLGRFPTPDAPASYDVVEQAPTPVAIDADVKKKRDSGRRPTKKDKELIAPGLMTAPARRARPTAIRRLAAPSRLREVHNSDDLETANSTSGPNYPSTAATPTDPAGIHNESVCPQIPIRRLNLSSLGRNPSQDHSSTKLSSNPDPELRVFPPKIKLTINRTPDLLAPPLVQPQILEHAQNEPFHRVGFPRVISARRPRSSADQKAHGETHPGVALPSSKIDSISTYSLLERSQAARLKDAEVIPVAMKQSMAVTADSPERPILVSADVTPKKMLVGQTDYIKQPSHGRIPVAKKPAAGSELRAGIQRPVELRKSGLASKEKFPSSQDPSVTKSGSHLADSAIHEKSKLTSSSMVDMSMANLERPRSGNARPSGAIGKSMAALAAVAKLPQKILARVASTSLYSPQSSSIHEDETRNNTVAAPTNSSHMSLAAPTSTSGLTVGMPTVSTLPSRKSPIATGSREPSLTADYIPKTASPPSANPMPSKATSEFHFQAGTKASISKQRPFIKNQKMNSVPHKTSTIGRENNRSCDALEKPPRGQGGAGTSESIEKSARKGPGEYSISRALTFRSERATPSQRQDQKESSDILPADFHVEFKRKPSMSSQNSKAIRPEANKAIEKPAVKPSTKSQHGKSRATSPTSAVEGGGHSFEPGPNSPTASPETANPHVTRKRLQAATELALNPHASVESLTKMGVSSELILEKTRPQSRTSTNVGHQESQLPTESMLDSHHSTTVQVVIPKRRASELSNPSPTGQLPKKRQKRNTSQAAANPPKRASAKKASRKSKEDLDDGDSPFRLRKSGVRKKKPAYDGNGPDA